MSEAHDPTRTVEVPVVADKNEPHDPSRTVDEVPSAPADSR